jgi:hypothetical protein
MKVQAVKDARGGSGGATSVQDNRAARLDPAAWTRIG